MLQATRTGTAKGAPHCKVEHRPSETQFSSSVKWDETGGSASFLPRPRPPPTAPAVPRSPEGATLSLSSSAQCRVQASQRPALVREVWGRRWQAYGPMGGIEHPLCHLPGPWASRDGPSPWLDKQGWPLALAGQTGPQKGSVCPGPLHRIPTVSASLLHVLLWLVVSNLMIQSVPLALAYTYCVKRREGGQGMTIR